MSHYGMGPHNRRGDTMNDDTWTSVEAVLEAMAGQQYIADRSIAMAVFLAAKLEKPLLIEGEPGCGKTEIAKVLAAATGADLIRLQCYEGLDATSALYEWNYPKQLLTIRLREANRTTEELEADVFSDRFLLERPLLRALRGTPSRRPVLLIDEIDRADEEFEGLLLELLSDYQITIPEIGTIKAQAIPFVVITSNRTRELSDALKRRCLYVYIGYPSLEKEVAILRAKVPALEDRLATEIAGFVQRVRAEEDLVKRPGTAETLDWAAALMALGEHEIRREFVEQTLGFLVKDAHDLQLLGSARLDALLGRE